MSLRTSLAVACVLGACWTCASDRAAAGVEVGDAYARDDNGKWTIGTDAVQMIFEVRDGRFLLSNFTNKLAKPAREYLGEKDAMNPLGADRQTTRKGEKPWTLIHGETREVSAGGRPAVQLDLTMTHESARVYFHVMAYPGTPILRQWAEIENCGRDPYRNKSNDLYSIAFRPDGDVFTNYWMVGGNSQPNQGEMHSGQIGQSYRQVIATYATYQFVPWMGFRRNTAQGDGCFVSLDFLGSWQLAAVREGAGNVRVSASSAQLTAPPIDPGKRLDLPVVFYGVFERDLDDMSERIYNWQYEYMWDYTHDDWYAKMPFVVAWYGDSDNLQQQWAGRLGDLDMNWTDYLRTAGMELLWEDAGWSATRTWRESDKNTEGVDFAETRRFLTKNGMKLIVWFRGRKSTGLLDSKVGSWGNFQMRTDGLDLNAECDRVLRNDVTHFLESHRRCSFHTCSSGSTYAHTFEIQRLTDLNYDSDLPGSDYTNANWSYLDTPDKWFDTINCWDPKKGIGWTPNTGYRSLAQVPRGGHYMADGGLEPVRKMCDLYHYLLQQGVAGRWSHVAHPVVVGDDTWHYCQRMSFDRRKSFIILKHRSTGEVTIYPRGLVPEESYLVEFEVEKASVTRTGADLMKNGIVIKDQKPGELIYLNLPNRPRGGRDKTAPKPPGRVVARRETNIGFTGMGVYWSPGSDDNWVSYYEVRRGETILGKASTGTYFFDHSEGWDPRTTYSVRTVDGDGNPSDWTTAAAIANCPMVASVMGGLYSRQGRENWRYETTVEGKVFRPMTWVPPAKKPAGDVRGTTVQRGGAEGYWEGADTARVGRGWQQASKDALCVRTWMATQAGTVRVVGRVMKEYYHRDEGESLRAKILHNDKQVWPDVGWAMVSVGDLVGRTHDVTLQVAPGDTLRFVLDKGKTPEHDILAWIPRIVYTDGESPVESPKPIRILCGSKDAYTDKTGNVWSVDKYFVSGEPLATKAKIDGALPTPDDQTLYQHGRQGSDFRYVIPAQPGLYTLRVKFAEPEYEWFFSRPFNLSINGREVMHNADVCQSARGWRKAHERVFRYVVPNAAGTIDIRFTSGWEPGKQTDKALVQAIEVLPEQGPAIRLDCGANRPFIDWHGFLWNADPGNKESNAIRSEASVSQASPTLHDQEIYRTALSGNRLHHSLSVPNGLYTVHLKFAELWLKEPGHRPMDIEINGRMVREKWDPATAAGQVNMAADFRVEDVTPDVNGRITITLTATGANAAILQGIEVE